MEKIISSIIKIQKKVRQFLLNKKTEYLNRNRKKGNFQCFSLQIHSIYDPFEINEDWGRRSHMMSKSLFEFQVKPVLDLILIFDQSKLESCISNKSQELAILSTANSQLITSATSLIKIETELIEVFSMSSVFKVIIEPCIISKLLNILVSDKTHDIESNNQVIPGSAKQYNENLDINSKTHTSHNYSLSHIVNPGFPEPKQEKNHSTRRHSIQLPKISTFFPEIQEKNKLPQSNITENKLSKRRYSKSLKPKSNQNNLSQDLSNYFPVSNQISLKSSNLNKKPEIQKQSDKHASLPDIHQISSKSFQIQDKPQKQNFETEVEQIVPKLKKKHKKSHLHSNSIQLLKSPKNPKLNPTITTFSTFLQLEDSINPASTSSNPNFTIHKSPSFKKLGKKLLQAAFNYSNPSNPLNLKKVRSSKIKTILKQGKIP